MTEHEGGDYGATTPSGGAGSMRAGMTLGEQIIGLGAAVLLAVDLIAGLIIREFGVSSLPWFLALLAVAAIAVKRWRGGDLPLPYTWVLKTLGYSVGVITVYYALYDFRDDFYDGADIFWALLTYAAGIAMGVGAYLLSQE